MPEIPIPAVFYDFFHKIRDFLVDENIYHIIF